MKKLLLSIALLAATTFTFAGPSANIKSVSTEKNISATIRSQITFPDFLVEKEGAHSAAVFFKVTEQGTIKVLEITCEDKELKANLVSQIENMRINTAGMDTRDTYKVVIRFETL